jgi:glycerophosphoryl diester phosphodiesterase
MQAQAYNPRKSAVRAGTVQALRVAGFDVYVWTVNDEKTTRKLIGMGVSGIITDFPQTLTKVLGRW